MTPSIHQDGTKYTPSIHQDYTKYTPSTHQDYTKYTPKLHQVYTVYIRGISRQIEDFYFRFPYFFDIFQILSKNSFWNILRFFQLPVQKISNFRKNRFFGFFAHN